MKISSEDLYIALKSHFGFNEFKGLQESVIKSIISQNNTFAIMPTGGGKSLCYQLPALMQDGTAIVVSPLIALMKNQVDSIRGISDKEGVAHVLNSSLVMPPLCIILNNSCVLLAFSLKTQLGWS